jgi:hypothetical protein
MSAWVIDELWSQNVGLPLPRRQLRAQGTDTAIPGWAESRESQ